MSTLLTQPQTPVTKKYSEVLWTERYRPKKIENCILPQRIRDMFVDGQIGDNYLFGGLAGTGKTTLAKILAADRSMLYIDASTERGIDVVRTQIIDFVSTNSMISTKKKVVIIDESDRLTKDAQDSLKATIEKYHQNAFFVFTANNPEKLIDPLKKSRLTFVNFNFSIDEEKEQKQQYGKRIQLILKNEGDYTITPEAIMYLLTTVYPDMRKIIKLLYQATRSLGTRKQVQLQDLVTNNSEVNEDLYQLLLTEYREEKLYTHIKSNYSGKESQVLTSLGGPFLEFIASQEEHKSKVLSCAMITNKYIYESTTGSIDPLITLLACAGALSSILR